MRNLLAIAPIAILAAACSAGAREGDERPSGAQGQRAFEVGAFESVSLEGSHDVVVTVGGAPSVRAEGDAEALERLDIRVENGNLRISDRRRGGGWFSRHRSGHVTVHVTAPALNAASIGGSGDMRIDRVEAPNFAASIGGSGDMAIGALRARRASFSIAGSGGIRAAGQAEEADISIAGSGGVSAEALETRRADVSIVGSGDVSLRASEAVDASIMGSGDINVTGTARCSVSKMGSGDVHCSN
ncbi:MAG TPA: head GIN domain-containing protein [Allosphingosinicella sp.]|nr:head GIN domain-containing protein [Allosphingosinicella sp.]